MSGGLTPKQESFCQKYIELGCATKAYYAAYDAAGSKPITANRSAKTLLDNPKIAARLRDLQAAHLKRHEVTVDWVVKNIKDVAERCLQVKPVLDKRGKPVMVETPDGEMAPAYVFDSSGANRSLELLGKHIGMFVDKHEITGKDGGPIVTKEQRDAAVTAALGADA